jgi:hypothetical protein
MPTDLAPCACSRRSAFSAAKTRPGVGHITIVQLEGNALEMVTRLVLNEDERRFTPWTTYPLERRNPAR